MNPISRILVVDDHPTNRLKLTLGLRNQGHEATAVDSGSAALALLESTPFDLVLLDIVMPIMDGYEVLAQMKSNPKIRDIPVIVISAQNEIESVIKGIEMGAEDYLPKTFDPILLRARIGACLEKKRFRDQEIQYLADLQRERERAETLLRNIIPEPIAQRLKEGPGPIADNYDEVTVLFADVVGFTEIASRLPATSLVNLLNVAFSSFDDLAQKHGVEKIKTIGDAYMAVGGLPVPRSDHAESVANMALDMLEAIDRIAASSGEPLRLRIGIHTGPAIAGVIGTHKFSYDLWGNTVNIASRMESQGAPGRIQVSESVYQRIADHFVFEKRGTIAVKGKGECAAYFLISKSAKPHTPQPQ